MCYKQDMNPPSSLKNESSNGLEKKVNYRTINFEEKKDLQKNFENQGFLAQKNVSQRPGESRKSGEEKVKEETL